MGKDAALFFGILIVAGIAGLMWKKEQQLKNKKKNYSS